MKHTDEEILQLLSDDPDQAMEILVHQYTGLIWSTCSHHLAQTEDVKECVNETFSEFYRSFHRFDPQKGTLSSYLCAIAKHRAVTQYQKNKEWQDQQSFSRFDPDAVLPPPDIMDSLEQAEWRILLKDALTLLSAEDQKILELKYYENMTLQEISDALGLPYETVKKRHQRSIGKLRKALIGLLVLALMGILGACAYMALRYFGVIPGYGINTQDGVSAYVLEEPVSGSDETTTYTIEDAFLINGIFQIRILQERTAPVGDASDILSNPVQDITLRGVSYPCQLYTDEQLTPSLSKITLDYTVAPDLIAEGTRIPIDFSYNGIPLSFTLVAAEEKETSSFQTAVMDERGILAIPHRKEGHLVVDLYPLNQGSSVILPSLVRCLFDELDPQKEEVTMTSFAGDLFIGQCIGYSPMRRTGFYSWDFGEVPAGEYTLSIPYVYEGTALSEDLTIPLSLTGELDTKTSYLLPGGSLQVLDLAPISAKELTAMGNPELIPMEDTYYWTVTMEYTGEEKDLTFLGIQFSLDILLTSGEYGLSSGIRILSSPKENQITYLLSTMEDPGHVAQFILTPENAISGESMYRRWNQTFELTFTAP